MWCLYSPKDVNVALQIWHRKQRLPSCFSRCIFREQARVNFFPQRSHWKGLMPREREKAKVQLTCPLASHKCWYLCVGEVREGEELMTTSYHKVKNEKLRTKSLIHSSLSYIPIGGKQSNPLSFNLSFRFPFANVTTNKNSVDFKWIPVHF